MITLTAILNALAALPELIKLIMQMVKYMEAKLGPDWIKKAAQIADTFEKLEKAQTTEERKQLAKDLSSIFNG